VLEVVRILARVDGSLAHLYGFHHLMLATARLFGAPDQWRPLLRETVRQQWFWGNALNPLDARTTLSRHGEGFVIDGAKSWDNMGQRQTDSGGVAFTRVRVEPGELLDTPGPLGSIFASLRPCIAQLILANVYLGLGEGALAEARGYTRSARRAWIHSSAPSATEDPYVLHRYGELWLELESARLLSDRAASLLSAAWLEEDRLTARARGETAIAIAAAKAGTTRAGLRVANGMFDVMGARATAGSARFDRFWRNLRTHTLHDPVDYKFRELGDFALNERLPTPSFYS
jgi:alkylation response protein AidB-like acyl-CoA dehydrogenase